MRALLNAQGSLGDIRPLLALAKGLRDRGHEVTFCAPPDFRPLCENAAIRYIPLGPSIDRIINREAPEIAGALEGALFLSRAFLKENIGLYFEKLLPLASDSDIVLGSGIDFAGSSVAERRGLPYRFIAFAPVAFASASYPPVTFPLFGLPPLLNKAAWKTTQVGETVLGLRRMFNRERRAIGLKPAGGIVAHMGAHSLLAADPFLAPLPADVTAACTQTGYWFEAESAGLAPALLKFIRSGPKPVYVGFGSMPPFRRCGAFLAALAQAGQFRFVAQKSSFMPELRQNTNNMFLLDKAPHSKLFPLLAGAIHHGGSGTTHTAARAGIPQFVIPYSFDQYYWGDRVRALELGPAPVKRAALAPDNFAEALRRLPLFRNKAAVLGKEMQSRNGLETALGVVEKLPNSCRKHK